MLHRIVNCCLVALLASVILHAASIVQAGEPDPDTRIEHLVVGDGYHIQVERHGVQDVVSGNFAKETDRWIVLHLLSEGRNERGVPVLSSLPLVGRRFKTISFGRTDEEIWIPRDAATIRGRIRAVKPNPTDAPSGDDPSPQAACWVVFVGDDHKVAEREGKIEKFADDQLTLTASETFSFEVRKPGWSNLPLVGGYFVNTRTETRETHPQFARGDILCVRISNPVPVPPEDQASVRH
jgi:hypothetical protein